MVRALQQRTGPYFSCIKTLNRRPDEIDVGIEIRVSRGGVLPLRLYKFCAIARFFIANTHAPLAWLGAKIDRATRDKLCL